MTGAHAGGRVLVVVPGDVEAEGEKWAGSDDPDTDGRSGGKSTPDGDRDGDAGSEPTGEPFLRGSEVADQDHGESGSRPDGRDDIGEERPGEADPHGSPRSERSDGFERPRWGRDCNPETVVSELDRRLSADVVSRSGETAIEYVEELGPTLDCVVVLGDDRPLIHELVRGGSVPMVVYEPPLVGAVDGTVTDTLEEFIERVQTEIRADQAQSELQESNARLTTLSHYAEDITACETVEEVLRRTVEATTDALAFDHCVVLLVEDGMLVPQASTLPEPKVSATHVSEGIAGRTLATGDSEIVPDMQSDPDAVPEHENLHAVVSVPIGSRGVIQIASGSRDAFDERDLEFVEILAGYTREALERIEREVTLREERDRLHAFFGDLPAPAIYVERHDGVTSVEEANAAYGDRFGDVAAGSRLSALAVTDAEVDQYDTAFETGDVVTEIVERPIADGDTEEFVLSVVPVSPPGVKECAYGIYVALDGETSSYFR